MVVRTCTYPNSSSCRKGGHLKWAQVCFSFHSFEITPPTYFNYCVFLRACKVAPGEYSTQYYITTHQLKLWTVVQSQQVKELFGNVPGMRYVELTRVSLISMYYVIEHRYPTKIPIKLMSVIQYSPLVQARASLRQSQYPI